MVIIREWTAKRAGACIIELQRIEERDVHILLLQASGWSWERSGFPPLSLPDRPCLRGNGDWCFFFCPALFGCLVVSLDVRVQVSLNILLACSSLLCEWCCWHWYFSILSGAHMRFPRT
jgi:hypothetical protein